MSAAGRREVDVRRADGDVLRAQQRKPLRAAVRAQRDVVLQRRVRRERLADVHLQRPRVRREAPVLPAARHSAGPSFFTISWLKSMIPFTQPKRACVTVHSSRRSMRGGGCGLSFFFPFQLRFF